MDHQRLKNVVIKVHEREIRPEVDDKAEGPEGKSLDMKNGASNNDYGTQAAGCSAKWTRLIKNLHKPIMKVLQAVTQISAKNPKRTVLATSFISLLLIVTGLLTNFTVNVQDENVLWTPKSSNAVKHSAWIEDESGFPPMYRHITMIFHANGGNVLGQEQVLRIFDAVDTVRTMKAYDTVCKESSYTNTDGIPTCPISGVVRFWNSSSTIYNSSVTSDDEAIKAMSAMEFPDGTPVAETRIFGFPERNNSVLTSVLSYTVPIYLPPDTTVTDWELDAVDAIVDLDETWAAEPGNSFRVEVHTQGSFAAESTRAIRKDIPLVPVVFIVMSVFICTVFFRKNKVYSRSLLGFGAVVAVLLSIMSGFGIMFLCAIPFTNMTQILPFIIFGIGVDDAFIIMGSYSRTDHTKNPVERIANTINDIGISIFLTTATSTAAFGLGCVSDIPAVFWLCLYAFPTISIVLIYQLTFFVACIVLDERRVIERRRDCCICVSVKDFCEPEGSGTAEGPYAHIADRVMASYAEKLLKPWVKVLVVIGFATLLGLAGYSASNFSVAFKFTDVLPSDSYMTGFVEAFNSYTEKTLLQSGVYFRFVDQSNHSVQEQMENYVADLVEMSAVSRPPDFFWLRDFKKFVNVTGFEDRAFRDQIYTFLQIPLFNDLYKNHISLDSVGNILESRTFISMDNVDPDSVDEQIDTLQEEFEVTRKQPINSGRERFAFFTYQEIYNIWSFYSVTVNELILTTTVGVVAVTGLALLLIPHWSAALFVFPLICILYIDLLGVMQWAGLHINAVTYVALVMSIGLLVDYIMHVLLRYYECSGNRKEKTVETLCTIGTSIFLGGISTFLGILPLAFGTSDVVRTIFISFLGIVTLGMSHGLILLPTILSMFGPEDQVSMSSSETSASSTCMVSM